MNRQSVRASERQSSAPYTAREQAFSSVHGTRAGVQLRTRHASRRSGFKVQALRPHPSSSPRKPSGQVLHPSPRCAAFTLIELMVVIVIIAILVGIVIGVAKYAQTKAGRSRAQAEIAAMETALESFKSDNGYYPSSTEFRNNAGTNSILLYTALTRFGKQYFTFKPNQLRDGGDNITFNILCTPIIPVTVTNVAIMDAFGQPYNYFRKPCGTDGQTNGVTFDLWSYGPDGRNDEGANDDITNWRQ